MKSGLWVYQVSPRLGNPIPGPDLDQTSIFTTPKLLLHDGAPRING